VDRTLRAALVAALIGLVGVGGVAAFLGVPATAALVSGLVAAVLFGGLLLLAARRADTMAPPGASVLPQDEDDQPATEGQDQ
jgi:heme A synthase